MRARKPTGLLDAAEVKGVTRVGVGSHVGLVEGAVPAQTRHIGHKGCHHNTPASMHVLRALALDSLVHVMQLSGEIDKGLGLLLQNLLQHVGLKRCRAAK